MMERQSVEENKGRARHLSSGVEMVFWLVHVLLLSTDDVTADGSSRTDVVYRDIKSALIQCVSTLHTHS